MIAEVERVCGRIDVIENVYAYDTEGGFLHIHTNDNVTYLYSAQRGVRAAKIIDNDKVTVEPVPE